MSEEIPPDERPELLKALAWHRHELFSRLVCIAIGVAAETHKEELRRALGSVFSLQAVERETQRMLGLLTEIQNRAVEAKHLLEAVHKDIDRIEKRMDAIHYEQERRGA